MKASLESLLSINLALQITVWLNDDDPDEAGEEFASWIKDRSAGRILVDLPPKSRPELYDGLRKPDAVVGVTFHNQVGKYIFYATVEKIQLQGLIGAWLALPQDYEAVQRRRHVRVQMAIPCLLLYQGGGDQCYNIPAITLDVSGGGVRFRSAREFSMGDLLTLQFRFHEDSPLLTLKAKVVYSEKSSNPAGRAGAPPSDYPIVSAVQFQDIGDSMEKLIVSECFRREMALRREQ